MSNTLFGERVNVAGLLPGADYVRALAGVADRADIVVLPRPSLDYFGQRFLDGMTPAEVSNGVGVRVVFASQWSEIAEVIQGRTSSPERGLHSNGAMWSQPIEGALSAAAAWIE